MASESAPADGLLASVPRLTLTLLDVLRTRIEIVSTELEEERERLRELVVYGFWSLFLTAMGLATATLLVVFAIEESYRLHALAAFAAFYLLLGAAAAARVRYNQRTRPRLFATTLAELRKDCAPAEPAE